MAILLSMRALPFATYAVVRKGPLHLRAGAALAYLVFPIASWSFGASRSVEFIAGGMAYYLLVSFGVNPMVNAMARSRLTRTQALLLVFGIYVFLPGAVFPDMAMRTFLVAGCELALSAYSYCAETSRGTKPRPSTGDCLFFLFVNPTIVYTVRGHEADAPAGGSGFFRAALGILVMFANVALLRPFVAQLRTASTPALSTGAVALIGYAALRFSTVYAAHSGLASIQIGLTRQVGWVVPERYHLPFLAKSPIDFWRRWNSYLRVWLEAYVFLPLARRIGRYKTYRHAGPTVAAGATLLASGLLHDAFVFAGRHTLSSLRAQTEFFAAAAALLVAWRTVAYFGGELRAKLGGRVARIGVIDLVYRLWARLALVSAVLAATLRWG
jgi:hypothetical protein